MIEQASLVIGNDNFAVKENSFLGYALNQNLYVPREMDVVRATTATRVNSDGLIEQVPYNLLQRSEEFNNALWTKSGLTVTANSVIAPNGTLTADTFTTSNVNATIDQSVTLQNPCTFSIYVKYIDSQFIQLYSGISAQTRANFDILNGVVGTKGTDTSNSTIENVGNGWYKLTATFINNSGVSNIRIKFVASLTSVWGAASTNAINSAYFWGAQLVTGTSAKTYFPTTDRLDIPRVDYSNGTPSILVEPQRTNLALRSEEFENINWVPASATITSNSAISPSGTLTADTFAGNGTNNLHLIGCNNATPVGVTTISVFIKKNTNNFIQILGSSLAFGANVWANFDLNNGVLGSVGSSTTAKIENYGNGWYRCSITGTSSAAATVAFNISLITSATSARAETNSLSTSVYLWGAQMELGSNATSYIPTIASSVTRNADVISKTGISSLIGQTEGTMFADINLTKLSEIKSILTIDNGTTNEYISLSRVSTNIFRLSIRNTALGASNVINSIVINDLRCKIAIIYQSGNLSMYVNGVLRGTSTNSANYPSATLSQVVLNNANYGSLNDSYNSVVLFKTKLTNAECIALTTI